MKKHNVPVSMDKGLLAQVDRAAAKVRLSRSETMRQCIRFGLPGCLEAFGRAERASRRRPAASLSAPAA